MVGAVMIAVGAVGFTTTAITVGTRGMADELSLSTVELGWVVNAYLVSAASLVLVGGRLGDIIGRRRTFLLGLAVFAGGSLLGAASWGFIPLVVARFGQGIGAALILPATIELISEYSTEGGEGDGFRWRGLVYASSFAIGPLIGGVLTDWLSWRWIFGLDVALVLVAAVVAFPLVSQSGRGTHKPTRDLTGAVLVALLVGTVVLLAEQFAAWDNAPVLSAVTVGLAAAFAYLLRRHERRTDHPLVHTSIIRDRRVLGANLATVGASLGMLSLLYFFNLFAQSAATFDSGAMSVVAALIPFIGSLLLCAYAAHWLGRRVGRRWPPVVGLSLMTLGFAMLATTAAGTTKAELAVPLILSGLGAGIANASLTSVAVLNLPAGRINEAAGWISLSRFLGSAMALAIGTSAFLSVAAPAPPVDPAAVGASTQATSVAPPSSAFDTAVATLDRDLSAPLLAATQATTSKRFSRTMGVTAALLAIITVLTWWLIGPKRRSA
jgi:DHA2 family methylenomycin A resistance protein-like MFS transporter